MKKIIIGICSVAAAGALFTGIISSSATVAEKNSVGSSKALEIALADAGVKKENAFKISSEFDKENGRYIFDVDFSFNGKEYDYTVDAKSGEILSRDIETESDSNAPAAAKPEAETTTAPTAEPNAETTVKSDEPASSSQQTTASSSQQQRITLDEAKKVALGDAGVSSSKAQFTKSKLDRDDGRYEYEIEFIADNKKYEYTVDAYTGKVLEKEVEAVKTVSTVTTTASSSQQQRITLDEAKKVALGDAGVSSSKAQFTKSKLDRDDGRYEYEIEFIADNKEYEYTVDAYTGKVLEKEVETVKTVSTVTTTASNSQQQRITLDEAKKVALGDAGVSSSESKFTKSKLDRDDGRYEYEIEFIADNKEYEYTVDAYTGKVLEKEVETVKTVSAVTTTASSSQQQRITLDEAKKVALGDAGVSSSKAKFTKSKLDRDDGRYEYEIEFIADNKEYEYTVDAYTGKVLEKEASSHFNQSTDSQTSSLISIDKARSTALDHAGLKASEVVFEKVKLEKEHGRYEYEVEFSKGNVEYEYTINAKTGAVIDFDKEYDD